MTNGWALPRWLTWTLLVLGLVQSALSPTFFNVFQLTMHGVSIVPYVNAGFAMLAQFSHSISFFGYRVHPALGAIGVAIAAGAAMIAPAPGATPTVLFVVLTFVASLLSMIARAVTNATPNGSPESPTAVVVTPSTPKL